MAKSKKKQPEKASSPSAFKELGLAKTVKNLIKEIQELYLCDEIPFVVGYSGGKDSSAVLQLIWLAISKLEVEQRKKKIHVISTDTLVEQPIVSMWVDASHDKMRKAAEKQQMPITPNKLTPAVKDTFWVNLIGKGYPKPTNQFRWCTSRMKINPSNQFIRNVVRENGEAILVLGTRKAESQRRAANMTRQEKGRIRDRLSPNVSLPNSLVYSPIEDWTNDDVWLFLMQVKNPWGFTNKSLLGMYQGASADNECPLVVDTSTPSCGSSRFGCWTCTVVDKDRSMEAMIKNDHEKEWMAPLLEFRNELAESNDRYRRDFRRIDGRVQLMERKADNGKRETVPIPGPYKKKWRERWLERVLEVQTQVRELGPPDVAELKLISLDELTEIRRIWLYEKHEFDDSLPKIYEELTGEAFPKPVADDQLLGIEDWQILQELCDGDEVLFQLQADLLDVERQYRGMSRRAGVYDALMKRFKAGQFKNEEEALEIKRSEKERLEAAENGLQLHESDAEDDGPIVKQVFVELGGK